MAAEQGDQYKEQLKARRWQLLDHLHEMLERPMTFLAFVWLVLVVLSFVTHIGRMLHDLMYAIWAVFVLDFLIEFLVAPHKLGYLKKHWLTAISLAAPALSVFRVLRIVQVLLTAHSAGYLSLLQLVSSFNRSMHAIQQTMRRRGIGYLFAITVVVLFAGAAGMQAFESPHALIANGQAQQVSQGAGIHGYGDALWWTAMLLTTIGSQYWPLTPEGRILCWFLSLYAISVFGYVTASIASHFIGEDTGSQKPETAQAGDNADIEKLQGQIVQLSGQISALMSRLDGQPAREQSRS